MFERLVINIPINFSHSLMKVQYKVWPVCSETQSNQLSVSPSYSTFCAFQYYSTHISSPATALSVSEEEHIQEAAIENSLARLQEMHVAVSTHTLPSNTLAENFL